MKKMSEAAGEAAIQLHDGYEHEGGQGLHRITKGRFNSI